MRPVGTHCSFLYATNLLERLHLLKYGIARHTFIQCAVHLFADEGRNDQAKTVFSLTAALTRSVKRAVCVTRYLTQSPGQNERMMRCLAMSRNFIHQLRRLDHKHTQLERPIQPLQEFAHFRLDAGHSLLKSLPRLAALRPRLLLAVRSMPMRRLLRRRPVRLIVHVARVPAVRSVVLRGLRGAVVVMPVVVRVVVLLLGSVLTG